jgi:hypothetical protein
MEKVLHCDIENYVMPILPETNAANDYGNYKGSAANHQYVIQNVIDFDQLTDIRYLSDLLQQNFHVKFDANQCTLVKDYAELQLKIDLEDDTTQSMQDILEPITDSMLEKNPWFWAYAVFKFEHNNKLTGGHRLWSVNEFKVPQTRLDLLQYQYRD